MHMDGESQRAGSNCEIKRQHSSRRAVVDSSGDEVVKSGCFTRNVSKHTCCVMWITFFLAIVCAFIPIGTGAIKLDPTGLAELYTPTIPQSVAYFAWVEVFDDKFTVGDRRRLVSKSDALPLNPATPKSVRPAAQPLALPPLRSARALAQRRLSESSDEDDPFGDLPIYFYYQGLEDGDEMFTPDAVVAMAGVESMLLSLSGWATYCSNTTNALGETRCASPQSVLRYLYTNDALEQEQCEAGYCAAQLYGLELSNCSATGYGVFPCVSTVYDWRDGTLAAEADWPALLSERLCDNTYLAGLRTTLLATDAVCVAGTLSSEYVRAVYNVFSPFDDFEDFADENEDWVELMAETLDDAQDEYSATKSGDVTVSTSGAAVNVWWSADWSGYPDPLDSLMIDLFYGVFSVLVIFVIVLLNTGSLLLTLAGLFEIVISMALAMFLWMCCGQTQLSTFEMLGIFLILCIGADDIFVFTDTWKESAAMPAAISGSLETRFTWTYNRAAGAMLTTTATTVFCLLLTATAPFPMLQTFGIFVAFVVMMDYLLVITWYASTVLGLARLAAKCCPPGRSWECSCCCKGPEQVKERAVTKWFRDKFAPCLHKLRWGLIVLTVGLLAGGIATVAALYTDGQMQFWVAGNPDRVLADITADEFGPADEGKVTIQLLYGMNEPAVKFPTSSNLFQAAIDGYFDKFEVQYLPGYDWGPDAQEKMVADCETIANNSEIVANKEAYCVLNDLKEAVGAAFPYADEAALRVALEAFYASDRYAQLEALYGGTNYADNTGFVAEGDAGISAIFHGFNATMPTTVEISYSGMKQYYSPWEAATDEVCDNTIAPCIMASVAWSFIMVLRGLAWSAIQNIVIALVVSYFVLVAVTRNVIVPALAVVSIGATVTWVLAGAFLVGYKMSINVALLIVMVVGMSVDYAVHITHFYNEAGGSRYEKAQSALHGVGVSVVGGAVTTGGAALPLIFVPNILFFQQAGCFILFTAISGIFFAFFMLVPLLMACGPENAAGDLRTIYNRCRGK